MKPHLVLTVLFSTYLAGCSSVPKPPIPDEGQRVPANHPRDLAVLKCTAELAATKSALANTTDLVERNTMALAQVNFEANRLQTAMSTKSAPPPTPPSQIFVILYKSGVVSSELAEAEATRLITAAHTAEFIEIRGRTDGVVETINESRVARQRAERMRAFLVRNGVDNTKINATWQPIGDHLGANDDNEGRALNRRVEVEIYTIRPNRVAITSVTAS